MSAPVPVPFLWTLDFGFGTWIWDLDLGLGFGTGLGLDNTFISKLHKGVGRHSSKFRVRGKSLTKNKVYLFGREMMQSHIVVYWLSLIIVVLSFGWRVDGIIPCESKEGRCHFKNSNIQTIYLSFLIIFRCDSICRIAHVSELLTFC